MINDQVVGVVVITVIAVIVIVSISIIFVVVVVVIMLLPDRISPRSISILMKIFPSHTLIRPNTIWLAWTFYHPVKAETVEDGWIGIWMRILPSAVFSRSSPPLGPLPSFDFLKTPNDLRPFLFWI